MPRATTRRSDRAIYTILGLLAAYLFADPSCAQDFPSRPIKLIVGPSPDVFSRIIAEHLQQAWGQPVVVEPRPGAGGKLAVQAVSTAAPDGYTMLFATPTYTLNTAMKAASYDLLKEFEPVAIIGLISYALVINPNVPVHSVKDLLELAKAKPGFLNYASAGIGSFQNLSGELFKVLAGVDIVHVPYKGGGPSMLAVIAGEAQLMFSSIVQTVPNIQGGHLRALATGGAKRSPILPELPTIAEAGVPGYVASDWWGILAPAGTPAPIVAKLHGAIEEVLRSADTRKNLDEQGATPLYMSTAEFGVYIKDEMTKWGPVVQKAGIKPE
jgi:tripartite-type tricarboxylate transporter receptor subunit TctC